MYGDHSALHIRRTTLNTTAHCLRYVDPFIRIYTQPQHRHNDYPIPKRSSHIIYLIAHCTRKFRSRNPSVYHPVSNVIDSTHSGVWGMLAFFKYFFIYFLLFFFAIKYITATLDPPVRQRGSEDRARMRKIVQWKQQKYWDHDTEPKAPEWEKKRHARLLL